jgi:hypothetical protein
MRKRIARSARGLGDRLERKWHTAGVLQRLGTEAERYRERQSQKGPIGRGGHPLGPKHVRKLDRLFEQDGVRFFADLIEGELDTWRLDMRGILSNEYVAAYDAGGRGGQLKLGIRPNFKLRNPGIIEALTNRANMLSGDFSGEMFDRLRSVVAEEFYVGGAGPFEVAETLRDEFSFLSKSRARTIARTETLVVTETAQFDLYKASGVGMKRWLTTLDGKERPAHFTLHGQLRQIDEPFEVDDEDGHHELMFPGDADADVGQVVNCILPGTMVSGPITAGLKAWYSGEAVELRTRRGHRLSVTVNHPILTDRGFLAAQLIHEGDYVVGYRAQIGRLAPRWHKDKEQAPRFAEEVFNALAAGGSARALDPSALDLDGDQLRFNGKVQLVGAASIPTMRRWSDVINAVPARELVSAIAENRKNLGFELRSRTATEISRTTTAGGPGSAGLAQNSFAVGAQRAPLDEFGGRATTYLYPSLPEAARKELSAAARFVGQLLKASPGEIELDEVVEIRRFWHVGHVYDYTSDLGYFASDNIISRNCRCSSQPIVSESQILSEDTIWRGDLDPDEFARDRRNAA